MASMSVGFGAPDRKVKAGDSSLLCTQGTEEASSSFCQSCRAAHIAGPGKGLPAPFQLPFSSRSDLSGPTPI